MNASSYSSKCRIPHGANPDHQVWLRRLSFPSDASKASHVPFSLWASCFWTPRAAVLSLNFSNGTVAGLSSASVPHPDEKFVAVIRPPFPLRLWDLLPGKGLASTHVPFLSAGTQTPSADSWLETSDASLLLGGPLGSPTSAPGSSRNSLSLASKYVVPKIAFLFSPFPFSGLTSLQEGSTGFPNLLSHCVSGLGRFPSSVFGACTPAFLLLSHCFLAQILTALKIPSVQPLTRSPPRGT